MAAFFVKNLAVFLLFFWVLIYTQKGHAELFKWVDNNGTIHFTDDLNQVPMDQRSKAEKEGEQTKENLKDKINVVPETYSPALQDKRDYEGESEREMDKVEDPNSQEFWEKKVKDTREALNKAQQELDEVLIAQRKNLESGPGMHQRKAHLASREDELKKKINYLEYQINEGLADEAREAGVPAGWVR